jgi:hypothetical protein
MSFAVYYWIAQKKKEYQRLSGSKTVVISFIHQTWYRLTKSMWSKWDLTILTLPLKGYIECLLIFKKGLWNMSMDVTLIPGTALFSLIDFLEQSMHCFLALQCSD